jgi:hypothetical protein
VCLDKGWIGGSVEAKGDWKFSRMKEGRKSCKWVNNGEKSCKWVWPQISTNFKFLFIINFKNFIKKYYIVYTI